MKTNHTSAPWAHDDVDHEIYSEQTDHGAAICTVNTTSSHITKGEAEANARLIAAAPTMLSALIEAKKLLESVRHRMPKSIRNSETFHFENILANVVNKAIQKATQP